MVESPPTANVRHLPTDWCAVQYSLDRCSPVVRLGGSPHPAGSSRLGIMTLGFVYGGETGERPLDRFPTPAFPISPRLTWRP